MAGRRGVRDVRSEAMIGIEREARYFAWLASPPDQRPQQAAIRDPLNRRERRQLEREQRRANRAR